MRVWRLVIISSALALLVILTILCAMLFMPPSETAFLASLNDKYELLTTTESPKIILVGGSSTAFGIDSEKIEKELNYRVVNSALVGGLGLRYSLEFVKNTLNDGDIVIVAPEYIHLFSAKVKKGAFNNALVQFPHSFTFLSLTDDPISLSEILLQIQNRVRFFLGMKKPIEGDIYSRKSFNKYGDVVAHLDSKSDRTPSKEGSIKYQDIDPRTVKQINDFYDFSTKKGVHTFMTFSPYPMTFKSGSTSGEEWVEELGNQISMPIISNPDTYGFPLEYFWDSASHLNATGRQHRTEILIEDIRNAFNESNI